MNILDTLGSAVSGGALGIAGHLVTTGLKLFQRHQEQAQDREIAAITAQADAAKAAHDAQARIAEAKPTGWLGAAEAVNVIAHPLVTFVLLAAVLWMALGPEQVPDHKDWVWRALVHMASMSAAWMFGAVAFRQK